MLVAAPVAGQRPRARERARPRLGARSGPDAHARRLQPRRGEPAAVRRTDRSASDPPLRRERSLAALGEPRPGRPLRRSARGVRAAAARGHARARPAATRCARRRSSASTATRCARSCCSSASRRAAQAASVASGTEASASPAAVRQTSSSGSRHAKNPRISPRISASDADEETRRPGKRGRRSRRCTSSLGSAPRTTTKPRSALGPDEPPEHLLERDDRRLERQSDRNSSPPAARIARPRDRGGADPREAGRAACRSTTQESASPGMSIPCQRLRVPSSTRARIRDELLEQTRRAASAALRERRDALERRASARLDPTTFSSRFALVNSAIVRPPSRRAISRHRVRAAFVEPLVAIGALAHEREHRVLRGSRTATRRPASADWRSRSIRCQPIFSRVGPGSPPTPSVAETATTVAAGSKRRA